MINYKIKKQEVNKYKIPIEKDENVNLILNNLQKRFNTNQEGLVNVFSQNNLDYQVYLDEVKVEIAWQKLIFKLFNSKINLNEEEIKKEIDKILSNQKEIEEYELAEIEIEFENEQFKKDKINVIKQEIKSIGFENAAVKYSIAPSATDKGNIGWVSSSSLSRNILNEIKNMNLGDVSEPIVIANSILFYKLLNSKKTSVEKMQISIC